jgi:hypothetical protein
MHDDLLAWEAGANGTAPDLVVVSMGDEEATRAEGAQAVMALARPRGNGELPTLG